jgi:hypothetical protein
VTDVSTYDLSYKLQNLQDRVERIEQARLEEQPRERERRKRRDDALWRGFMFAMTLVLAVIWAVILTVEAME